VATQLADVPNELRSDFDIVADPELHRDPQQRLTEVLLNDPRDIVYTPRNGGHWLVTSHRLAAEILGDARRFGSFPIGVPANFEQRPRLIPLESDVDEHRRYRRLLLPVFKPEVVKRMEEGIRARAREVLDSALKEGEVDFLWDIAKPIPTHVFVQQMGLEPEMLPKFYEWEDGFYRAATIEERTAYGQKIAEYLNETVARHRTDPQNDIVGLLLTSEVEGERLATEEVNAIAYLLFLAGIDTVATMLSFIVLYLAANPDLYQRLRTDEQMRARSVDEFMRLQAFINLNRIVAEDMTFHGVQLRQGDNVVIPTFVTSRDPREFGQPHSFDTDRSKTELHQHHAFGAGAHKCIGLHLAKLEVSVVLDELCRRVRSISLVDPDRVTAHGGTTMGLNTLPVMMELD